MAGVPAGRLSIEIVAEIARLQQDLDKAKRAVKSMSNDIARDTKAANDNIAGMGRRFAQTGQQVTGSSKQMAFGARQLGFQINDIATQFALGTKPMTIFAQQGGQVFQAMQLMSGGTSRFAAFMGGPWGVALTAATLVLVPLISRLFEAEGAMKKVEFATYGMSDAQGILGSVMDMTTGKINTQKDALLALARAQLIAGQIKARTEMAAARSELANAKVGTVVRGGFGGGISVARNAGDTLTKGVADSILDGSMTYSEGIAALNSFRKAGQITEQQMLDTAKSVIGLGVAAENLKVFQDAEKGLLGDKAALAQFLDPAKAKKGRGDKKRTGPTDEEVEARWLKEMNGWTQRNLRAQMELAMSVEERVELEKRAIEWDRKAAIADVEVDKHYSDEQKQRLLKMIEANDQFRLEILERERIRELAKEEAEVAQARHATEMEALNLQAAMADTEAQRKSLALQIFDAEQAFLRERLQAVITANTFNGIMNQQAKIAQMQLDGLNANAGAARDAVGRQNETSVERYLREVNLTRDQMDEAFDQITMNGLDAFNNGLVDAIVNFRSLGDVAQSVIRQILADLLRLQIQQAIIGPLSSLLGLGGASPQASLVGSVSGAIAANPGLFAKGTRHAPPGMAIVGEEGPELVDFTGGERVYTNAQTRGIFGGTSVHKPTFVFPNVTNAREAREAGAQAARRYRRAMNDQAAA